MVIKFRDLTTSIGPLNIYARINKLFALWFLQAQKLENWWVWSIRRKMSVRFSFFVGSKVTMKNGSSNTLRFKVSVIHLRKLSTRWDKLWSSMKNLRLLRVLKSPLNKLSQLILILGNFQWKKIKFENL